MSNVSLYLQYARIAQYEESAKIRRDSFLKGGAIVPDYSRLLYILQTQIGKRFVLDPNDPTLTATSEYMYSLSGSRNINTTPIATPFIIIIQPQSQTVDTGDDVTFLVAVAGGVSPYTYQWYYNNVALSGETDPTLELTNVDSGDAGNYKVVITDSTGQILTSNVAVLTVNAAAITGFGSYGDIDPNTDLQSHVDNFTYQESFNVTHNAPINAPIPQAGSNNKYWIIKVPSTESDKTTWTNGPFNFGTIPDSVFQSLITFGGFDYYYTRVAASFDYTIPLILS